MTEGASRFLAPDFLAVTIGMVVYCAGVFMTRNIAFLRNFNIPEPVTGGFVAALVVWLIYGVFNLEIAFELRFRDLLLVIFFASVGVNARLADLAAGGRTLLILCLVTVVYVFVQNVVGMAGALAFGMPASAGVIMGSVALVGGHGTTIAWAPVVANKYGFGAAMETGIAVATLGLIVASVLGGPIAKYLVEKHRLQPAPTSRRANCRRKPTRPRSTRWA